MLIREIKLKKNHINSDSTKRHRILKDMHCMKTNYLNLMK